MIVPREGTIQFSDDELALPLALYAQTIQYDECAFWGVRADYPYPGQQPACHDIWLLEERERAATYLAMAQQMVEDVTGYPLAPRWITETHPACDTIITSKAMVRQVGLRTVTALATAVAVDKSADPHVIQFAAPALYTAEQIKVYHTASAIPVIPSAIEGTDIGGGSWQYRIEIPRCRTVKPEFARNPAEGWDYDDLPRFADALDVQAEYASSEQAGNFSCHKGCGCAQPTTSPATAVLLDGRLGIVSVCGTSTRCCAARDVELTYRAGSDLNAQGRNMIMTLAHTLMPTKPCGCDVISEMWLQHNFTPQILTAERYNNPFGLSNGAWLAYRWAEAVKIQRAAAI